MNARSMKWLTWAMPLAVALALAGPSQAQQMITAEKDTAVDGATAASKKHDWSDADDRVRFGSSLVLAAGERCKDAVAIFGNATIAGEVDGDAVAIGGDAEISGEVDGDAVAVGGTLKITGTVNGQAVAVGGGLEVGPEAVIRKGIVSVGGPTTVAEGAAITGERVEIGGFLGGVVPAIRNWLVQCPLKGRLIAPELPWTVLVCAGMLLMALLLAVLFRGAYTESVRLTDTRPGAVLLAGVLSYVALAPLSFALVAIVVGIPVVPVLWVVVTGLGMIGLFAVLSEIGVRILEGLFHRSGVSPIAGGLLGCLLFLALAMIPVIGFLVVAAGKLMGMGAGVYAFLRLVRASGNGKGRGPAAMVGNGDAAHAAPAEAGQQNPSAAPRVEQTPGVPVLAGMWERLGAALIDFLLVALVCGVAVKPLLQAMPFHANDNAFGQLNVTLFLVYLAVMWAWKQTTVGNTIFRLKVQRLDREKLSPGLAIVRALALVLSVAPLGLGFWWMNWDSQRKTWHDKIAGTEVVKMPVGAQLL